jgi:hypothetical protein
MPLGQPVVCQSSSLYYDRGADNTPLSNLRAKHQNIEAHFLRHSQGYSGFASAHTPRRACFASAADALTASQFLQFALYCS